MHQGLLITISLFFLMEQNIADTEMFVNVQELRHIDQYAKQTIIVRRSITESKEQIAFSNFEISNCSDMGVHFANGDNCTTANNASLKIHNETKNAKLESGTEGSDSVVHGNRYIDDNDTVLRGQTTGRPFPSSERGIEYSVSVLHTNTTDASFPRSNDDPHGANDTTLHGHAMFSFNFTKRGMEDADSLSHGYTTGTTLPPSYREKNTATPFPSSNHVSSNEHEEDNLATQRTTATVSSDRVQGIHIDTSGSTFDHETITSPLPASELAISNGVDVDHDVAIASQETSTTRISSREPINDTHVVELENGSADAVSDYLSRSSFREDTAHDGKDLGLLLNTRQNSSTITPLTNYTEITPDVVTTEDNTTTTPFRRNGYISRSTYELLLKILSYCNRVCFVIAMILSLLSLIIFCDNNMRSPTSMYLVAFNLVELLNVLMGVMFEISESLNGIKVFVYCSLYLNTFVVVALTRISYWLNCVISAERFVAIAFPFKAKFCKVVKHPLIFIVAVVSISLLFHSFTLFKFHLIADVSTANHTSWKYELTDIFHGYRHVFVWMSLASKVLFVLLPLVGSLLMNIGTVAALLKHRRLQRRLNILNRPIKERYNTKCILVSTFVFVVLVSPVNINAVAANVIPEYGFGTQYDDLFQLIMKIGILCSILSGCTNFISYLTISTQFRNVFLCLCRKIRPYTTQADIRTGSPSLSDFSPNITETRISAAYMSTHL
ncbi:hypothetical protein SNE40_015556 [Patella caerulea]|uniref:G-protein coupled receptors family 1 profile domain-containing protein n=1 Tax=Patella caerulea TaxID=87958 RepID=A0AAN8PS73_PATCE